MYKRQSDYISEALMKSVIHSSLVAIKNPNDYEARSNIMWTATWALNTPVSYTHLTGSRSTRH